MHALVSLLPSPFSETVADLRRELEQEHGSKIISCTSDPHFSWRIANGYDIEQLKSALRLLATKVSPFPISTTGLGIFTGHQPVVYIPLVKTKHLIDLHQMILEATDLTGTGLSRLHDPDTWVPQISLAFTDGDPCSASTVTKNLATQTYTWEMTIDNLALISKTAGELEKLKYQIPLTG